MSIRIGIGLDNFASGGIDADATTIYNRIIADGGVSNLTRLNYFVVGLKTIYGSLTNVPVCYDAHWIGYKLGSGTGATAGQAAAKLYSLTVAGDAVQATAASQPLLLAHNGVDNYWWGSGVTGNFVSTPNAAANQITGSFDIAVYASVLDWSQSYGMLQTKFTTGANGNYYFCTMAGKKLQYGWSDGSARAVTTTINTPFANNTSGWLKASHNTTAGVVSIYYSNDLLTTPYLSINWILLELLVGSSGNRTNYNCPVEMGSNSAGQNVLVGKIYRATISNSIGGTPVVDFNPATYNASTSQTAWTSATGEVWTISTGTATTGYKGVLVDRTRIMSDGIDDKMTSSYSTLNSNITLYTADTLFVVDNVKSSGGIDLLNGNIAQKTSTTRQMWVDNGNNIGIAPTTANLATLNLGTGSIVSGTQKFRINNGSDVTLSQTFTSVSKTLVLFGAYTYGQTCFNTFILSSQVDNNTVKTAMYNLIRSLNNNAF